MLCLLTVWQRRPPRGAWRSGRLTLAISSPRWRLILMTFGPAAVIAVASLTLFPMPPGVAVGMALTYRSSRILNFAQGELGTAPAVLAVSLVAYAGWSYLLAMSVGLV